MRSSPSPRLLTPPREEEEIYPYRRVWSSIAIEGIGLFFITFGFYAAKNFLGFTFPANFRLPINLLLALAPVGLWLVFSYLRELRVLQPRRRLMVILVVTGLAANAIGFPLLNDYMQIDQWLSLSSAVDRIWGYALTVGVVQEVLKYMVVRYFIWPDRIRIRLDSVAYAAASAVGYATVANLQFIANGSPSPEIVAVRVFSATALHTATAVLVGYGLASSRFGTGSFILLPFMMFLSAVITGIAIPLRSGLVNAGLVQGTGNQNPLLGLLFSTGLYVVPLVIAAFLFNAQENRQEDTIAG
ncbi:MAG: PrsW family intramembrane metalloprotease [Chitinophagaceae bacterium]|nr:PrsW family intramembrane metalloprotease [Anaerolineae bacterium]